MYAKSLLIWVKEVLFVHSVKRVQSKKNRQPSIVYEIICTKCIWDYKSIIRLSMEI